MHRAVLSLFAWHAKSNTRPPPDERVPYSPGQITELKAAQFRMEQEHRTKLKTVQKDHEAKVDVLQQRIKSLQKEVATLKKATSGKQQQPTRETKDAKELMSASLAASSTPTTSKSRGSGSDSDSPS